MEVAGGSLGDDPVGIVGSPVPFVIDKAGKTLHCEHVAAREKRKVSLVPLPAPCPIQSLASSIIFSKFKGLIPSATALSSASSRPLNVRPPPPSLPLLGRDSQNHPAKSFCRRGKMMPK